MHGYTLKNNGPKKASNHAGWRVKMGQIRLEDAYSTELDTRFLGRAEALVGDARVVRILPHLPCATASLAGSAMLAGAFAR